MEEFLSNNWYWIAGIGFLLIDKIVALTKTKYDDIIWTALKYVIKKIAGKEKKSN